MEARARLTIEPKCSSKALALLSFLRNQAQVHLPDQATVSRLSEAAR
jgi:hypothetical protein